MWLFGVHLGLPLEDRLAQLDALLAQAATREGPVILAGDFNSSPTGDCPDADDPPDDAYARLVARYDDAWVAAGNDANATAGYTYEALAPIERIDYVLVQDLDVVAVERLLDARVLAASDHTPVVATLRLPS